MFNFWLTVNFAVITLKLYKESRPKRNVSKNADGIASSEDPDQTAPQSDLGHHCLLGTEILEH